RARWTARPSRSSGAPRREALRPGDAVKLRDRVAIVTGAASGIGQAIARAIEKAGGAAAAWRVDITDAVAVAGMVANVVAQWGTVHVLVNNAGWDRPMPFVETTPEFWDRILALNLRGPIACTNAVLPHMIRQEY